MTAFTVTGRPGQPLPLHLLGADGAHPLTPADALMLERLVRGERMPARTVSVALSGTAPGAPNRERWELYGWQTRRVG